MSPIMAIRPIIVSVLDIWIQELGNILVYYHLPKRKCNLSSVADHLLFCNHSASYEEFSILMRENEKFY